MADMNTIAYLRGTGSTGTPPYLTQALYNKSLLDRAQPELVFHRFGMHKPLKQRNGNQMMFRRYEKLSKATVPLSDGITPPGVRITRTNITAEIKQYGNFTIITDMAELTEFDPQVNQSAELMGENAGETTDTVIMTPLVAGTNFVRVSVDGAYATQAHVVTARTTVDGALTKKSLDYAQRFLEGQNAKRFTPQINASDGVATQPVARSYWSVIHTDTEHDLYDSTLSGLTVGSDFIPVERYSAQMGILPTEVGKYRSIRFVTSTEAKVWTESGSDVATDLICNGGTPGTTLHDVYATLIFARDAYGLVPLSGGSARAIIHRAGGSGDPLNQRNSVGWKYAGCSKILNDNWMFRIEHGCALL